ncbi:uncharacterized protein FTJAE_7887 [Fusarium tjaetaba]|uniref:Uncharacterized protein n=1 Tax=Fusarium tjaetaba TaxID=1567544 RepID=A0A8H5RDZ0_9HYPO|nr:uncharacterized protein FTJAE_7887 [Fusarium tjaetaba]KAF5631484.1 hypothetical protein FTJAE_7887 [Fusarium tjaetaba]
MWRLWRTAFVALGTLVLQRYQRPKVLSGHRRISCTSESDIINSPQDWRKLPRAEPHGQQVFLEIHKVAHLFLSHQLSSSSHLNHPSQLHDKTATMNNDETESAPGDEQTQLTPADDQEPTLYHQGLPGPFLVVGQSLRLVGAIDGQGNFQSLALQTCYGLPSHQQKVSLRDLADGSQQIVLIEGSDEALKLLLLAYEAAARFCRDERLRSFEYEVVVDDGQMDDS